jgi:hypothetical protein
MKGGGAYGQLIAASGYAVRISVECRSGCMNEVTYDEIRKHTKCSTTLRCHARSVDSLQYRLPGNRARKWRRRGMDTRSRWLQLQDYRMAPL